MPSTSGAVDDATAAEAHRRTAWKMGPATALDMNAATIPPEAIPLGLPMGRQPTVRVLVQGVRPPLDTPLAELCRCMGHPDGVLYVCVSRDH